MEGVVARKRKDYWGQSLYLRPPLLRYQDTRVACPMASRVHLLMDLGLYASLP